MSRTILSLCSGVGGLELGLERAGVGIVETQIEIDLYCRRVLDKHYPHARRMLDIKRAWRDVGRHNVVCAGFPCQPVSVAGKRKAQNDERWLWPYVAAAIEVASPQLVVLENVTGLRSAGLRDVLADLAEIGFDATWDHLSAADVGAPHIRPRIFIAAWRPVVDTEGQRWGQRRLSERTAPEEPEARGASGDGGGIPPVADAHREGKPQPGGSFEQSGRRSGHRVELRLEPVAEPRRGGPPVAGEVGQGADLADSDGARSQVRKDVGRDGGEELSSTLRGRGRPVEPDVGGGLDGLLSRVDAHRWPAGRGRIQFEWEPPRTTTPFKGRGQRIKMLGNAVVPQVAEAVGRWALACAGMEVE